MISSAGSLRTSRSRLARQTSRLNGQVCSRVSARTSSGSSRFTAILPSCASLPISHRTIAEILHVSRDRSADSRRVRSPIRAWRRMWLSRFSIPAQPRRQDLPPDPNPALELADEARRLGLDRHEPRHGLSMFRDDDALRIDLIEEREALGLEASGRDGLHGQILRLVTKSVHFVRRRIASAYPFLPPLRLVRLEPGGVER